MQQRKARLGLTARVPPQRTQQAFALGAAGRVHQGGVEGAVAQGALENNDVRGVPKNLKRLINQLPIKLVFSVFPFKPAPPLFCSSPVTCSP